MGCEPTVQTNEALLLPYKFKTVHKAGVFWSTVGHGRLSESCSSDLHGTIIVSHVVRYEKSPPAASGLRAGTYLVGIRENSGHTLRSTGTESIAGPTHRVVPPRPLTAALDQRLLPQAQTALDLFVQHPLECALGDTQVAGTHALEETTEALVAHNLADAVPAVAVAASGQIALVFSAVLLIELQARLDEPDGVRGRAGRDACRHGTGQMYERARGVEAGPLRVSALTGRVDIEVDAAGGDDAEQVGAEAFEQGARALETVHIPQDLDRLGQVVPY